MAPAYKIHLSPATSDKPYAKSTDGSNKLVSRTTMTELHEVKDLMLLQRAIKPSDISAYRDIIE